MQTFTETGADGNILAGRRCDPTGEARAVLVVVHGMGEHSLRYAVTAEFFADNGFVVYAYDHRGHGPSKLDGCDLGDLGENGWTSLVSEIGVIVDHAVRENPDLPIVILGHSMGSFATQQYLLNNSDVPDAVILSGTAALDGLEPALNLDEGVDLSAFNAPFAPARTDFDWLSRDDAEVDKYVSDELCGFGIDAASGKAMFVGARPIGDAAVVGEMRSDLPVLVAVGEHDPVNGQLALANLLVAHYRNGGLTDVTLTTYPQARHEILNKPTVSRCAKTSWPGCGSAWRTPEVKPDMAAVTDVDIDGLACPGRSSSAPTTAGWPVTVSAGWSCCSRAASTVALRAAVDHDSIRREVARSSRGRWR